MCWSVGRSKDPALDGHRKDLSFVCLHHWSGANRSDQGGVDEDSLVTSCKGLPVPLNWFDNQPAGRKCRTELIAAPSCQNRVALCASPIATSCTAALHS